MKIPIFYRDKPVFGFDIGHDTVKVMQVDSSGKKGQVIGYGHISFDERSIKNGVIIDPESIAKEVYKLISKHLIGTIDTHRVAASLPIAYTYNRILSLPQMNRKDLDEAVRLEAEQYIPMPPEELYIDYEIVARRGDESNEILLVAAPRNMVDSYMTLFSLLGLETTILESSISAVTRAVMHSEITGVPTLIIDFGSISSDISVYDTTIRVTGTIDSGGETVTKELARKMGITIRQAYTVKTRYGINPGKRQDDILNALKPIFSDLVSEIKKMVRFYQERATDGQKIEQIIILGGGANMPGMSAYLTDKTRIPTRVCNPWQNIDFGHLQPPHELESTLYTTAAGLCLINPKEVHND